MKNNHKIILSKDFLEEQYNKLQKTVKEISKEFGYSIGLIKRNLTINNIKKKTLAKVLNEILTKELLEELYLVKQLSTYDIALLYKTNDSFIGSKLKKFNIKTREQCFNILNQKFGKLTVIKYIKTELKNRRKEVTFLCVCDCGNTKECLKRRLLDGRNTSCGCNSNYEYDPNRDGWGGYAEINAEYWRKLRYGAKHRNIEFDITIEEIWNLFLKQDRKCSLSNTEISFSTSAEYQTVSLDRIDSNKGYTIDNVQWVHKDVNIMKMHYNQEYFIEICKKISNHNEKN